MFSKQKHSPSPQLKIGHKDEESLLLGWGGEGWGERDGGEEMFGGEGGYWSYHDSNISSEVWCGGRGVAQSSKTKSAHKYIQ